MRRIYIESFVGLLILFGLSLYAYEVIIYEINPDYDYVLEDHEGAAFRELLTKLSDIQGKEKTLKMLDDFVEHTAQSLSIVSYSDLPEPAKSYFSTAQEHPHTFYDSERHFWMRLVDQDTFYHIYSDDETQLRQAIELDNNLVWAFILIGFIVYSAALIWFLNRRVRKLERATIKLANGDLTARAPTAGKDQVGTLNKSFNEMADKISALITSNRSLTNAVAHDLRTPIFRIQWQADMLQESSLTEDQNEKILSILEDTDEMDDLISELLHFAKLESAETQIQKSTFDIGQLVTKLADKHSQNIPVTLKSHLTPSSPLFADQTLIKRALDNLLSNASRYAKSKIELSVVYGECVIITVEDDGNGIDEVHWPQIFDPFYSADPARNKSSSGAGLGLAIVKMVANKHKGSVKVEASELGGAKFVLSLSNAEP
ncbi:Sensor protein RstB [Vibrio thalassae]|uniref:histidine kinase n=1 Tax=Vibrio thalassae TaxID=1243014 RepID=A0A240ENQ6_9VIBR|nr:ATP-binding protein [Vibrio thalassae]SNX50246.1 Sensor protein RstB [Vibrio thalassae]